MKLGALFQDVPYRETIHWNPSRTIRKITADSRAIESGDVFVACAGSRMDGHDFLGQAIMAKAAAVVFERSPDWNLPPHVVGIHVKNSKECFSSLINRFYHYPDRQLQLVGITGTNGKTTISYLLHQLIRQKESAAYLGTLWYDFLGERRPALNTTPNADVLVPFLADMVREKVRHCIMEVSSHALDQRRVYGLTFDLAIFTQLTQDHLDYHKSMENYFRAKQLLFDGNPKPRHLLINSDCPYGKRLLKQFPNALSYSINGKADYQALELNPSFQGSHFVFRYKGEDLLFKTRFPMRHNISNLTAVLAALDILGFSVKEFRPYLQDIPGIPGRMEPILGAKDFQIFVDYAHTPDAVENVLSAAQDLQPRRILTLIGCGGDRDKSKRPLMARAACKYSDWVVFTSDNPRSEDPETIIADMTRGIRTQKMTCEITTCLDRRTAIEELVNHAHPGDVLFVLGKGHENFQILGDQKIPFDDRKVVRECLTRQSRVFLS